MYWFAGWPPFQIDANFGTTAAMLEMLAFSQPGVVKLLPALPEKWSRGSAEGLLCRGGIELSLAWDVEAGALTAALRSRTAQTVRVVLPPGFVSEDPTGEVELPAGESVVLNARRS